MLTFCPVNAEVKCISNPCSCAQFLAFNSSTTALDESILFPTIQIFTGLAVYERH